jgi:hypothetical protein
VLITTCKLLNQCFVWFLRVDYLDGIVIKVRQDKQIAKRHGIQQRRTYVKEVKNCRLAIRHFRHVKKRAKAKKEQHAHQRGFLVV